MKVELKTEKSKSADLQSKLAELLVHQPHVVAGAGHDGAGQDRAGQDGAGQGGVGQLPDVDPAAVSVVKKDSLGKHFSPK